MADNLDSLTNAKIREQLKLLGVKAGPVTSSTRSLWLKKLKSLSLDQSSVTSGKAKQRRSFGTSSPGRESTKLSGFSSDEEEFPLKKTQSYPAGSKGSVSRRRSALPRSNYVRNEERDDSDDTSLDDTVGSKYKLLQRRSLPRSYILGSELHDTLPGGAKNGPKPVYEEEVSHVQQERRGLRKYSFELEDNDADGVLRKAVDRTGRQHVDEEDQKIRTGSKVEVSATTVRRRQVTGDFMDTAKEVSDEVAQDNGQDDEELELAFASNSNFFRSWRFPVFIIVIVILLVCLVGSYMSLWSSTMVNWPSLPGSTSSDAGIKRDHVFQVLKRLHDKLSTAAGEKECDYPGVQTRIKGTAIASFAAKCKFGNERELINYGRLALNVVNLAMHEKYSNFFSVEDGRDNMLEPVTEETLPKIILSSKIAIKPFRCRIYQAAIILSKYLLAVIFALGILLGIYYVTKTRWMKDDEDTRLMFLYVEKIIETLRRHHDACQHDKELPAYLPILHVRDMLIPPREKKRKERAWRKAVDFLSSSDSRIRLETQRVAGEDFEVWRWIGVLTSDIKIRGASNHLGPEEERGRFWQGPAFDKLEKVVRLPIITPTPCLKIRYMHEGPKENEESWDLHVRDALLEKCNKDGAKILHIHVDGKSVEGCVYVKCDSLESAGMAFRSIYGNWFAGRLVIVKFVTVARYNQRFPEALKCTQPLKVSGDFPSSLDWNIPEEEDGTSTMTDSL